MVDNKSNETPTSKSDDGINSANSLSLTSGEEIKEAGTNFDSVKTKEKSSYSNDSKSTTLITRSVVGTDDDNSNAHASTPTAVAPAKSIPLIQTSSKSTTLSNDTKSKANVGSKLEKANNEIARLLQTSKISEFSIIFHFFSLNTITFYLNGTTRLKSLELVALNALFSDLYLL